MNWFNWIESIVIAHRVRVRVSEWVCCFPYKPVRNRKIFAATKFDHWYAARLYNNVLYKNMLHIASPSLPLPLLSHIHISFWPLFLLCIFVCIVFSWALFWISKLSLRLTSWCPNKIAISSANQIIIPKSQVGTATH